MIKKWIFCFSPQVTYQDGIAYCKKTLAEHSHVRAPLRKATFHFHFYLKFALLFSKPVLRIRIRIHRIHMFLGLPDPDPDPLVRGMDPDPALDPDHHAKK